MKGWRPGAWSYRVKVPLLIAGTSVLTALAVSVAIAVSARHWLLEDLHDHAAAVSQSLARGLVVHMARDDVWEAFEAVRAVAASDAGVPRCDVVVVDRNNRIFVSSDPTRFPVQAEASKLTAPLKHALTLQASAGAAAIEEVDAGADLYAVVHVPLLSTDKEVIGGLLMSYSHAIFEQRYRDTVATLGMLATGLVVLLIPLGWWLGHRLASPVARVTDTLYRLGEEAAAKSSNYAAAPSSEMLRSSTSRSELARLEHALTCLQQQLTEKETLQQQFVAVDRLAAIGRMTSGVAHEINNPLAGMLNALSNLRKDPAQLQRTVALIERGLEQIRQTLSALLIETKTNTRRLSPSDLEDLRLLVQPQAHRKHVKLQWSCPIERELAVPAAPVRQVVLNLLLNAVQASASWIEFVACADNGELVFRIANDGQEFPMSRRERPFDPSVGAEGGGLGLWASHQLVSSMGGRITLAADSNQTVFEVRLPLLPSPDTANPTAVPHEVSA